MPRLEYSESYNGVNDPYHPANARRNMHSESSERYTYTVRKPRKLQFSLGWELEANHVPTRYPLGVEQISDGSVNGDGAEFVVLPAITKSPRYVLGLLKDLVHAPKLNTDKSCGYHVHVSAAGLSLLKLRRWAIATEQLAVAVEDLAFKAVPDARQSNQYCRRIRPIQVGAQFSSSKYNNERRYHWFNIVEMFRPNGIRTMEIRLLGNTHRWKYLLAWTFFSMELANRGWELMHNPFDMQKHISALSHLLELIAIDIKPLEKRSDPIPQWIYNGLNELGIPANSWDRPLAKLSDAENEVKGLSKKFYSDNQATEENESSDDEDLCPCGCGEESYCDHERHNNGDCESMYCSYCHDNGDCGGVPDCEQCIDARHDDGEDCERTTCRRCHPRSIQTTFTDTVSANVTGNSDPLTVQSLNAAVTELRANNGIPNMGSDFYGNPLTEVLNTTIDNTNISVVRVGHVSFDESVNSRNDMEYRALRLMTDQENIQSLDRSHSMERLDRMENQTRRESI